MSKVSFINTDINGIRFSDKTRWGGKDHFHVIEEELLEENLDKSSEERTTLGGVLSVYRNLRENYELRRRYDEAGKFFIREMELKRKYREVIQTSYTPDYKIENGYEIKKNNIVRRNISLTGIYYRLSRYGESLWRPSLAGIIIVFLASFFFVCQSNPSLAPSFSFNSITVKANSNGSASHITHPQINVNTISSRFIGLAQIGNGSHWMKAGERGLADFLPLLPSGDIKVGLIDYLIKIVGGAVTFGLIAIALRRRFERKYTH
jgi:hypothetical protein